MGKHVGRRSFVNNFRPTTTVDSLRIGFYSRSRAATSLSTLYGFVDLEEQ